MNYILLTLSLMMMSHIKFALSDSDKFHFTINPNCSNCDDKPWLVYGKRDFKNHTLHYLWSAVKLPSFILASTSLDSQLKINWDDFKNGVAGSLSFTSAADDVFGISFQTLILFNDKKDTGTIDDIPEEDKKYASLSEFEWAIEEYKNKSGDFVVSFYTATFREELLPVNTKISISVTAFELEGRGDELPHLITMPGSTQLEITLDNLILDLNDTYFEDPSGHHHHARDDVVPISGFDHPRWALDTIMVTNETLEGNRGLKYINQKSLDDEYTPGVFDLNSITSSSYECKGGYFQWRPVCYLSSDLDINDSTVPNINSSLLSIDEEHLEASRQSIVYALFGDSLRSYVGAQSPVSFGLSKDGFYTKFNYTTWTLSMGLGEPPAESFSTVIIIVICVGVGLPFIMFLVGGIYLGVRKFKRRGQLLVNEE